MLVVDWLASVFCGWRLVCCWWWLGFCYLVLLFGLTVVVVARWLLVYRSLLVCVWFYLLDFGFAVGVFACLGYWYLAVGCAGFGLLVFGVHCSWSCVVVLRIWHLAFQFFVVWCLA
jgi:hypothetical protein